MSYLLVICGLYLIGESVYAAQHVDRKSRACTLLKLIFIVLTGASSLHLGWLLYFNPAPIPWAFVCAVTAIVLMLLPVTYYRFTSHFDRRGV